MLAQLLDILFPPREDEAALRGVDANAFLTRLAPALAPSTRPPAAVLLPFRDPVVRAALHEAKYHGTERAFGLLAAALADFLPDYLAESAGSARVGRAVVVPVPLGRAREKERGYNQVAEVAKRALAAAHDPALVLAPELLARVRETPTQVSLAREAREKNMRGAFRAAPEALARERPASADLYIVLDDVLTTGATLGAAVEALAAAGIDRGRILPVALAH